MKQSGVKCGTSGARGLATEMTDPVCYAYSKGFITAAQLAKQAAAMAKNQYESIFKNGDAISRAPTCKGIKKLENVPLKPAVNTKNTSTVPCMVTKP